MNGRTKKGSITVKHDFENLKNIPPNNNDLIVENVTAQFGMLLGCGW